MKLHAVLLIVAIIGARVSLAAELAELTAQRQKQLQDLETQRRDVAADQSKLLAEGAKLRQQIDALEREYKRLQAAFKAVPKDKKETDKDGKIDRKAVQDNRENDRKRAAIQNQLTAVSNQGLQAQNSLKAAESAYNEALARSYKLEEQWLGLADRFGRLTKAEHQAAMPQWDALVAANAGDIGPLIGRGLSHQHLGKPDLALADFTKAIEIVGTPKTRPGGLYQPLLVSLYCARARLHLAEGRERDSTKDFSTAFSVDPKKNQLSLFLFQGMGDCMQDKFAAAVLKFTKATQLYPEEPEGHRLLTLVYAACPTDSVRNKKKGVDSGQKACDLSKNADWACLYALAAAHAEAGSFDKASRLAAEAAALTIDEHLATCLNARQEYDQKRPLRMEWK